jgi:2-polyprenyl-3-methyl-5-hydroxy-6-metoxy-1,4-benzoquinol methylase
LKSSEYYENNRNEIVELIPSKYNKILEIGCGSGEFRANLKNECEYWGIEINEIAGKKAKMNLTKVIVGDYFKIYKSLPDNYFDLVICNDIIEHMNDHNLFFKTIKKKMTEKGFLIGSIPNVRFYSNLFRLLILKDWKYQDAGILDNTHLRFFTKKSLTRALLENGFSIDKLKGINGTKFSLFSANLILKNILILLFGKDSRHPQYSFRVLK